MAPAMNIFRRFHPNRKPVLWRILLTQVCLYRALERIRNDDNLKIDTYASYEKMCEEFNSMYNIDSSSKEIQWKQHRDQLDNYLTKWLKKATDKLKEEKKLTSDKLKEETDKKKNEVYKVYGGDNVSDKCPIEAVKLYLDQKLKEIYKTLVQCHLYLSGLKL
jgi:hypothetical protein